MFRDVEQKISKSAGGNLTRETISRSAEKLIHLLRRADPYYRDFFDTHWRRPLVDAVQVLVRKQYRSKKEYRDLQIAEERALPDEAAVVDAITQQMSQFLIERYKNTGKMALRAGNTKTYGLVKGQLQIRPDLPQHLRVGLFGLNQSFPAYVRFSGPGPLATPDPMNNGILSMAVKLMGVPGKKLLDDEHHTLDLLGISSPTFTTPNIYANTVLQREVGRNTPAWYFLNPFDSHYLDAIMQGVYSRTHANPLELSYYSCTPYLFGVGKAVKFAFMPQSARRSKVSGLTDNYLTTAMVKTLGAMPWRFDLSVQFQKDPVKMPVEDASVEWSETDSPFIPVATLVLPIQKFDYPEQMAFERKLSFNPWHTLAEHRPLGNQNRARKQIYVVTSRLRQEINAEPHVEPTGDEVFDLHQELPKAQKSAKLKAVS